MTTPSSSHLLPAPPVGLLATLIRLPWIGNACLLSLRPPNKTGDPPSRQASRAQHRRIRDKAGETTTVTKCRELVDHRYLCRENGVYWVNADHMLERCANERQEVPLLENQLRMPRRPDPLKE